MRQKVVLCYFSVLQIVFPLESNEALNNLRI